jgi:PadR family transcriptional regulator, regulatory protein PadR
MPRGDYPGELEQVVMLAIARLAEDAYGMSIRREIEQRGGRVLSIGAIYATLERLEDKKFIRSFERAPEEGRDGRARRFFQLTKSGVSALEAAADLQTRMWAGLRLGRAGRP